MMNCEICGGVIYGPSSKVIVDGAKLTVCRRCSGYGRAYWDPASPSQGRNKPIRRVVKGKRRMESSFENFEVVENYGLKIREARDKLGLNQEELAKLAKERLSIIQKIEAEKIYPNIRLSRILEHILKIKLIVKEVEGAVNAVARGKKEGLTIGDVIHFKKKSE